MIPMGYYTGWVIAIVLLFLIPLVVVLIEYMRRVNRQLSEIQDKLSHSLPRKSKKSVNNHSRDT